MFLMTLLSTVLLATSPSVQTLRDQNLDSSEGRIEFLNNKLSVYTARADNLNREIQDLSEKIQALSPEKDQAEILVLTEKNTEKMGRLLTMLPVLSAALSIDDDFQQVDALLTQEEPLSIEQQELLNRIDLLCQSLEK